MSNDHHDNERLLRCLWQTRAMLSDAIDMIAAAVGAEGAHADRTDRSTPAAGGTMPRYASLIVPPAVGGPKLLCQHTTLFAAPNWRLKATGDVVEICLAHCTGLAALSRLLRLPVSRPTLCRAGQVRPALEALSAARHAAAFRQGDAMASEALGFDDWFASRLYPRLGPSPMSPVTVSERALAVTLPADLPWARFERAFRHRMRQGSLFPWIDTDHGRVHCEVVGAEPAVARRYTLDRPEGEPVRALDLCVLDASTGVDRLIAVVETILIEHLLFDVVAGD